MLTRIIAMISGAEGQGAPLAEPRIQREMLAAACLFAEMVRMAGNELVAERLTAIRALEERFFLSHGDAQTLHAIAERREAEVYSDFLFIETVRHAFDDLARAEIFADLVRIAFADGQLTREETALLSRLARDLAIDPASAARILAMPGG
ncbi:MAG TPA: TerB family tellurite resistance protein [Micropepsaceae bacterium]|nr:TerB family tellurite resistance protein [Micropepsaceae bacterium]HRK71414.1 TerB family tellurite resistance protein [Micropepsaceae bacterium]